MYKFLALFVVFSLVGCRPCETCMQPNGGFVESCTAGQYSYQNRCYDHVGYIYHYRYYIGQNDLESNQVPQYVTDFPERTLLHSLQECDVVRETTHKSFESNSTGVFGSGRYTYAILSESCDAYYY